MSGGLVWQRRRDQAQVIPVKVLGRDVSPAPVRDQDKDPFLDQLVEAAVSDVGDPTGGLNVNEGRQVVSPDKVIVR